MNTLSDAEGNTIPFVNRRYIQEGLYTIKTYRLDYTKTVSDRLSWSLGTRFADVNTDSDQQSFSKVDEGVFSVNEEESSQFLIEESIFALYSKINSSVGKWSFSGGLRYEDSNTDGKSIFLEEGVLNTTVKKKTHKKNISKCLG